MFLLLMAISCPGTPDELNDVQRPLTFWFIEIHKLAINAFFLKELGWDQILARSRITPELHMLQYSRNDRAIPWDSCGQGDSGMCQLG